MIVLKLIFISKPNQRICLSVVAHRGIEPRTTWLKVMFGLVYQ